MNTEGNLPRFTSDILANMFSRIGEALPPNNERASLYIEIDRMKHIMLYKSPESKDSRAYSFYNDLIDNIDYFKLSTHDKEILEGILYS